MAEQKDRAGAPGEEDDPRDYAEPDAALEHVMRVRPGVDRAGAKDKLLARHGDDSGTVRVWASEVDHAGQPTEVLRSDPVAWERSRWNMRDVERAFPPRVTGQGTPRKASGGKRGPKPVHPWEELAVAFGALLWDERAGDDPEVQVETIRKIAAMLGHDEPSRSSLREHRDVWLRAYRRWTSADDAGLGPEDGK